MDIYSLNILPLIVIFCLNLRKRNELPYAWCDFNTFERQCVPGCTVGMFFH